MDFLLFYLSIFIISTPRGQKGEILCQQSFISWEGSPRIPSCNREGTTCYLIIKYSGNMWGRPHPDDLSRCENYQDFLEKLNYCIWKFFFALRKDGRLAVLVGDIRKDGHFYSIQNDLMRMGDFESFLVKGQFNCVSDNRRYKKPFIPVVTE